MWSLIVIISKFDVRRFEMDSNKSENLAAKLREAASSGKKTHVISRDGVWVVIRESSKKAVGKFKFQQQAINKARTLLNNGTTEAIIVHKQDGSIKEVQRQEPQT